MIRKATEKDIGAVTEIYRLIHDEEEAGRTTTGWKRTVYPTAETAKKSLKKGELYVMEQKEQIVATARINQEQEDAYAQVDYYYPADDREVLVLHTLVVSPLAAGHGYGQEFVHFYEKMARETGCRVLRMDTNERNTPARRIYRRMGYREAGIVPCNFQGLDAVNLVCLEKQVQIHVR
ncbi:MAG: GNAT family N-acetyltransferase [Clostridiales bacterium]|nr:GNAT family N-acetyltransferase [Clostridiales bacterium]